MLRNMPLAGVLAVSAIVFTPATTAAQAGAKVFFYDPAWGQPGPSAGVPPLPATGLTPVRPNDRPVQPQFVGIHYWFENDRGSIFGDVPAVRADGPHVRLHIRSNVGGYLTVWMADKSGGGAQLTPMKGQWTGYLLRPDHDYIVPGDFTAPTADPSWRVLVLFARSQTEQVGSPEQARRKIQRLSADIGRDGAPSLVRETDNTTPGQIGNYVVHREGGQAGTEIVIGR